jgi:outer membrane protein OmpA-like peptidoglycan-associated protein
MLRKLILSGAVVFATSIPLSSFAAASSPQVAAPTTLAQALNTFDDASVESLSCPSAGNCAAVGYYSSGQDQYQAFVDSQSAGVWHVPVAVGLALNVDNDADLVSVSCSSAGNCVAGGYYANALGNYEPMMVSEAGAVWSPAQQVAAQINVANYGEIYSVSCASNANCTAVGSVSVANYEYQSIVLDEHNGVWGAPIEVATLLNTEFYSYLNSVSCPSAGNCTAGGVYEDHSGVQAFAISEVNGAWQSPLAIATTLNNGGEAQVDDVSCATNLNCVMTGYYDDDISGAYQAFAASQVNGQWTSVHNLTSTINIGLNAEATSVSCTSPGNCVVGGFYSDQILAPGARHPHVATPSAHVVSDRKEGFRQAFVANEVNGVWSAPKTVVKTLNAGDEAEVDAVSCVDAANCVASGYYLGSSDVQQAFAIFQVRGIWQTPLTLVQSLNAQGNADAASASCALDGYCAIGGYYGENILDPQAFVTTTKFAAAQLVIDPFAEGSYALTGTLRAQIFTAATIIKQHGLSTLTAIGSTDALDTHQHNLTLGRERARAVRQQLLSDLAAIGVHFVKIATATNGDTQFVANNDTAAGRAANRRVVLTL